MLFGFFVVSESNWTHNNIKCNSKKKNNNNNNQALKNKTNSKIKQQQQQKINQTSRYKTIQHY